MSNKSDWRGRDASHPALDPGLTSVKTALIKEDYRLFYFPGRRTAQPFQHPALAPGVEPSFVSCPAWTRRIALLGRGRGTLDQEDQPLAGLLGFPFLSAVTAGIDNQTPFRIDVADSGLYRLIPASHKVSVRAW